jgi:PAS domain S-box-containing protein
MNSENTPPSGVGADLSPQAVQQLMHDLQVHQFELQSQNEELRRSQLALEASNARYFDLYDMAPVGYLTMATNGLILEANLSAASLLGVPRSALVKRALSGFIVKAHQDTFYQRRRQLLEAGEDQSCELQVRQSDGLAPWVKLHLSAVSSGNDTTVLRVIFSDISERVHLVQTLQEANRHLESARLQADMANQAKSEFLSRMSHELRSPLNAILGFAQLLEAGAPPPTPAQQASLKQILNGGWYLVKLVDEILDLASIESGHAALTMEPVSVAAVLQDCQALVEPLATARDVQISFPKLDGACCVHADPTRVKQVIINLLSNAIKYNKVGGSVWVTCSTPAPNRLRISVRDTGEGLPANKLAQLFQPFNRLGQENGATHGTGIGLVVSKQLAISMGGEMGVASTVGVGTDFWFELDLTSVPSAAAQ